MHFEKARGFYGEDARSFEAQYEVRGSAAFWTRSEIADIEIDRVTEALGGGMSIRETAAELGLSGSKVERLKKKATSQGKLDG